MIPHTGDSARLGLAAGVASSSGPLPLDALGDGRTRSESPPFGTSGLVLWFGGSPRRWHGLDLLPALLDHMPGATAVIAGEGATPVHPRIRALGWLDGPAHDRWIAASDVAVLPYPADAPPWFCPLKGFDARAGGLPIVASDVAAVRDHAPRWGETTLVPSDDVAAWSRAIVAAAARPRVVNARTWVDVARAWVAFGGLGG